MADYLISSFYGLLDILGSTDLDANQRELGKEISAPNSEINLPRQSKRPNNHASYS